MKPKVFVVQKQLRQEGGELVPKFDLSSAEPYGELTYLLSPTAGPFNSRSVVLELKQKLQDYRPGLDYLLLVGNPCLIGWATAVAAQVGRKLRMLQWSSREQRYVEILAEI